MKVINLYSLINISSSDIYNKMEEKFSFHMKEHEKKTLSKFLKKLMEETVQSVSTEGYIYDYHLIGNEKEFDILKNTTNFILNIELKSANKTVTDMQSQLKQNKYYLSKTNKKIYSFVYYEQDNIIYMLDDNENMIKADENLLVTLMNTPHDNTINIEDLLAPEKFLVSPFNDVEKFMNDDYLLTQSQISNLKTIDEQKRTLIIGKAGTGKTLLIYDLAKKYLKQKKAVLIIHCARLNEGQYSLNQDHGFSISSFKELPDLDLSPYDLVIVDEMQRLTFEQAKYIASGVNKKLIFSGDPSQTLNNGEIGDILSSKDEMDTFCQNNGFKKIRLSKKIRTNKNLSEFIQGLMDKKYQYNHDKNSNISNYVTFSYFNKTDEAKAYWQSLKINNKNNDKRMLTLPTSLFKSDIYSDFYGSSTSFDVIGQEFNTVVTLVGPNITYSDRGKLISYGTYYSSSKSFFQNITRTKGKLHFIIIDNEEFLNRLLDLL